MDISPSLKEIGELCFRGCLALNVVTFEPNSHLTEVGQGVFPEGVEVYGDPIISDPQYITLALEKDIFPG
jgi:hypothetical protein